MFIKCSLKTCVIEAFFSNKQIKNKIIFPVIPFRDRFFKNWYCDKIYIFLILCIAVGHNQIVRFMMEYISKSFGSMVWQNVCTTNLRQSLWCALLGLGQNHSQPISSVCDNILRIGTIKVTTIGVASSSFLQALGSSQYLTR